MSYRGPLAALPIGAKSLTITKIEWLAKRFEIAPNGCWNWIGYIQETGYGQVYVNGRIRRAHRVMWELTGGVFVKGFVLDHLCSNRRCVNPKHLSQVTQRVNTLRGNTLPARNVASTHCHRGHEFNEENTYITPQQTRRCRRCRSMASWAYQLRRRAQQGGQS